METNYLTIGPVSKAVPMWMRSLGGKGRLEMLCFSWLSVDCVCVCACVRVRLFIYL